MTKISCTDYADNVITAYLMSLAWLDLEQYYLLLPSANKVKFEDFIYSRFTGYEYLPVSNIF